jgi:predicted RNA-binding Zn ribbon-like protein
VLRCAEEKLCLAFVNTMAWRKTAAPEERLPSPAALVAWCREAGILEPGAAPERDHRWEDQLGEGAALYRQAIDLREAAYRLFRSRIVGETPAEADLAAFNGILAAVPPRLDLGFGKDGLGWQIAAETPLSAILAPIVWSAVDLMTGPHARLVRQCQDPKGCGWLFLDESRAGTRRWCSMGDCGNRAKARRHYLRTKEQRRDVQAKRLGKDIPTR